MAAAAGKPPHSYVFRLCDMPPTHETKSGTVRIADSTNFLVSKTIAAARVTIKPGGLREMHWHPNADEWVYVLKGAGRMTVFNTGPAAVTANFHAGDIGYIKKSARPLSREHRRHGARLHGSIPGGSVCGGAAVGLAGAQSDRYGRRNAEPRSVGHCPVSQEPARSRAGLRGLTCVSEEMPGRLKPSSDMGRT